MGQGLSRGARQSARRIAKEASKAVNRSTPGTTKPGVKPERVQAPISTTQDQDTAETANAAHQTFNINDDATPVSAGPWTTVAPPTEETVTFLQQKDEALVRAMGEMPELRYEEPSETIGSRKLSRSLPRDRSSHPQQKGAVSRVKGTLRAGEVTKLLEDFRDNPSETRLQRLVFVLSETRMHDTDFTLTLRNAVQGTTDARPRSRIWNRSSDGGVLGEALFDTSHCVEEQISKLVVCLTQHNQQLTLLSMHGVA